MSPSNPESFPGASSGGFRPEAPSVRVETGTEKQKTVESGISQEEARHAAQAAAPSMPVLPVPQPQLVVHDEPTGNPIVAADDDVIEREWVQKAKKIVSETKDDPFTQEHEISKLQADYIKKRYGKEIKTVGES